MDKIVVFFDGTGSALHMVSPGTRVWPPTRFACGARVPRWWQPAQRHQVSPGHVTLVCEACEEARQSVDDGAVDSGQRWELAPE